MSQENSKNKQSSPVKLNKKDGFEKIINLLHFAYKANKVVFGHDSVIRLIEKNKVLLVLTAEDLSENSFKSLENYALQAKINIIKIGKKEDYSQFTGKTTGIVGILDENFKSGIIKHFSLIEVEE